jgi:chemotaxis family two-component system response regulator Rcp1
MSNNNKLEVNMTVKLIDILLVEDNPGDVQLTMEALEESKLKNNLFIAYDGEEAMQFLRKEGKFSDSPKPDLIILDLNLPKKDGREVLKEIKEDENLRRIPVVVLTTSEAEEDVMKMYDLHANCYITKPLGIDKFIEVVKSIENFWMSIVILPNGVK